MIKVLLIEDSITDRTLMRKLLQRTGMVELVGEAETGQEGLALWHAHRPQLVIVDIHLPDISGLDVATALIEEEPAQLIVFATAQSQYLTKAFEYFAFDYLVKPLDYQRVFTTIHRADQILRGVSKVRAGLKGHSSGAGAAPPASGLRMPSLLIATEEGLQVVPADQILMITKTDRKTEVVLGTRTITAQASLDSLEKQLPSWFVRTQRGFIVNINAIERLQPWGRKTYILHLRSRPLW